MHGASVLFKINSPPISLDDNGSMIKGAQSLNLLFKPRPFLAAASNKVWEAFSFDRDLFFEVMDTVIPRLESSTNSCERREIGGELFASIDNRNEILGLELRKASF